MGSSQEKIRIATKDGYKLARPSYVTGHFAVHETSVTEGSEHDGTLTVTHIPTGRAVTTFCTSESQAREIADWLKDEFEKHKVDASESDVLAMRQSISYRDLWDVITPRLSRLMRDYLMRDVGDKADK